MEELQKRNTDCVYFLASPLTCKKGVECEYRHSEMARLNPRDCWYWLAGNCLKPTCAFRHPPLDGRPEVSSGSAPLHHQSTAPVNKATVPCYFYYNGFCNKGDWCPFLHGPDDTSSALKSSKTASAVIESLPLEKKTSAGSDTGIAPIKTCPSLCEVASSEATEVQIKPNEELMQSILNNVAEGIDSPHVLASVCKESAESDENTAVGSDSLLFAKGCIQTRSFVCAEQSSEDPEDDHVERDELLESSPGFDVLVDGHSENLGYENDPEFVLGLDNDGGDLNGQYFGYEYEDAAGYDTAYADAGALYDEKLHNSYDPLDAEHTCEYVRNYHCIPRERMMDHILPRKAKPLSMELAFDGQRGFDLRDYLKKRRLTEDLSGKHFSRRVESSHLINQSRKRARGQGTQGLHQRLAVQQESSIVKSFFQPIGLSNGANKQGRSRCSHINRSRQRHFKEKRWNKDHFSSDISRNSSSNKRSAEKSAIYWGPKTRNQIKQEKRKSHEIGSPFGNVGSSSTTVLEDFQSPKPLSEILKDKRRLNSVVNRNSCSS